MSEIIGRRIAERRRELEIKQSDLAQMLETTPDVVSRWERSVMTPHVSALLPLAKALKTTPNWLLGYLDDEIASGLDDLEIELLQTLRALSPERRQRALEVISLMR